MFHNFFKCRIKHFTPQNHKPLKVLLWRLYRISTVICEIHNNYNGTLQLGVNNATTLTLDSTSATFAGTVQTTGVKTPYIESAATNQSLFLYANGSGHIYFGDSTNGTNLYHYSNSNDGKYTSYGFDGN